ncbi:MAG: SusE domain-containing protein [Flavobacterium sp.]
MKNTFKFLLATLVFVGLWSCEDEQELMFLTPPASFDIVTPDAGTALTLSPDLGTNPALTVTWKPADYGTPTAVNYIIEIAQTGTNFENLIEAGSTNNTNLTWTVLELNGAAIAAGLTPFSQGGLDIRIKATVGTQGSQPLYSNVVTVLVTPFSTDLPTLAVPGNHQGWSDVNNFETAPRIASSGFGQTDYEGFMRLDGEFKFLAPNSSGNFVWGNTDWGDDGSFSGILAVENESNCIAPTGYYYVKANTNTLQYETILTNWGIVGFATTGTAAGWDNSIPLTYNQTTKKWQGTVALTAGEFKFRANNAWTINLGAPADNMAFDGGNLSVDASGTYFVELDLSNPRKYTYTLSTP